MDPNACLIDILKLLADEHDDEREEIEAKLRDFARWIRIGGAFPDIAVQRQPNTFKIGL